jgi:hypothetical protein
MLNMLRAAPPPGFGSPGPSFGAQHLPVPHSTSPDLHLQPKSPHVSDPVQQTPMHLWLLSGHSFSQVSSSSQRVSQYSPFLQHLPPHTMALLHLQFSVEFALVLPQV